MEVETIRSYCRLFAVSAGCLGAAAGLGMGLLGASSPNAWFALGLAGLSLAAAQPQLGGWRPRVAAAFAVSAMLVILSREIFPIPFRHPVRHDQHILEVGVVLLSAALLWRTARRAQGLLLFIDCIALVSLLGGVYGIATPYLGAAGLDVSPALAALLLFLSLGAAAARPDQGWMAVATASGAAGAMARRLLPAAIIVPIALGGLKTAVIREGASGSGLGPLTVVALIAIFVGLIGLAARLVQAQERARSAAEATLRESQERLQAVLDFSPSVIAVKDLAGRYMVVNRRLEIMAGKPASELLGRTFKEVFPGASGDDVNANDRRALAEGKPVEVEETVRTARGARVFHATKFPLKNLEGLTVGLGVITTDITERKAMEEDLLRTRAKLEEKLKETGAQLIQAQKMEAVGRLAGGVAHDFNNILAAILGFSELLRQSVPANDPRREDIEEIHKAGERGVGVTRQLLAFSRKQIMQPRRLDLNRLIGDIQKMLKRLLGDDVALSFEPGEGVGTVMADPTQIEQVIMNLAINARDAMPQGGRVTIATSRASVDRAWAAARPGAKPGDYAVFSVADTGVGLSDHVRAHLFEPFFTTKDPGKGTGLGLSTVYGIVHQSGGLLEVDGAPGRGAVFRVYLPAASEALEPEEVTASTTGGIETILLVEDDDAVRRSLSRRLAQAGYRVIEAGLPEQALRLAEALKEPIHLLLTDVVMPGMRGFELAKRLSPLHPESRAIYMTGYLGAENGEPPPAGCTVLQKPVDFALLTRHLRQALPKPGGG